MRDATPDPEKARSLLKMANMTLDRVGETDTDRYASLALRDYYDVARQLMEAIAAVEGRKSGGKGAHAKLIDWTASTHDLSEGERRQLHQMRKYRNRINYEGFSVNPGYLDRNREKIETIIDKLRKTLTDKLENE